MLDRRRGRIEFRTVFQLEVANDLEGQLGRLQDFDLGQDGSVVRQGDDPARLICAVGQTALPEGIADDDECMGDIVSRHPRYDDSGATDPQNGDGNKKEFPAPQLAQHGRIVDELG